MKIIVKRELCSGHARCASVAPEIYHLNDEGYNEMQDFVVRPGQEQMARRGARACPERALRIEEDAPAPGEDPA